MDASVFRTNGRQSKAQAKASPPAWVSFQQDASPVGAQPLTDQSQTYRSSKGTSFFCTNARSSS